MRHKATEVLSIIAGTVSAKEFNMYIYSWKYLCELRFTMIWDILEHCIVVYGILTHSGTCSLLSVVTYPYLHAYCDLLGYRYM